MGKFYFIMYDWSYNRRLERDMKKILPFSFYLLYFAAISSFQPFIVLFYQQLNFNGAQIGLLTGIPPLILMVGAPFCTGLADSMRRHRLIMGLGLVVAIVVGFVLPILSDFVLVFTLIVFFYIFFSPVAPLSDSATMSMLGDQKAMYGRIRMGGTIGFGLFAPIAGLIAQNYGLKIAFWTFSALMFVTLLASQEFSYGNANASASSNDSVKVLLMDRRWIYFLLIAFLGGLGSFSVTSYLYPYMKELGSAESQMGVAFTIAALTEIPIFFFGDRLVKKFSALGLLTIAVVLFGIRSLLLAMVHTTYLVWVVQAFGGMLFPAMWSGGVAYAEENAPEGLKSTGQGLFNAMAFGFGAAVSGFIGGMLLGNMGGRGMFLVFGIVILAGLGLIEIMKRILPDRELSLNV
jgi:MFS transporter, PPP family, 3-phenylpropionic acid transporter